MVELRSGTGIQFPCAQSHEFGYAENEGDNGMRID